MARGETDREVPFCHNAKDLTAVLRLERSHHTLAMCQWLRLSCSERLRISHIPTSGQEELLENQKRNAFSAELLSKLCYLVNQGVN